MPKIAVVLPCGPGRESLLETFMEAWRPLFVVHGCEVVIVRDGDEPQVQRQNLKDMLTLKEVMGDYSEAITNFNGGVRNLGFAYVAKYLPDVEYILTLDDDEVPIGDPIADHINALNMRVPISWMSTASEYMRGFPYAVREEAEVVLSHGVWEGVADWDGPTQLVKGNRPVTFPRMPIPKGIYFPMCSMNLAFKRCMLPYIFHAPWALGVNRFDDIFAGITAKRAIDMHGWAAVTGYARVHHERASNTFTNLKHEAPGIELNETYWSGDESHPYFKIYEEKLRLWKTFLLSTTPQT